jgi:hypothetical protein
MNRPVVFVQAISNFGVSSPSQNESIFVHQVYEKSIQSGWETIHRSGKGPTSKPPDELFLTLYSHSVLILLSRLQPRSSEGCIRYDTSAEDRPSKRIGQVMILDWLANRNCQMYTNLRGHKRGNSGKDPYGYQRINWRILERFWKVFLIRSSGQDG